MDTISEKWIDGPLFNPSVGACEYDLE